MMLRQVGKMSILPDGDSSKRLPVQKPKSKILIM